MHHAARFCVSSKSVQPPVELVLIARSNPDYCTVLPPVGERYLQTILILAHLDGGTVLYEEAPQKQNESIVRAIE